jgi:protein gp37
MNPTTIEWVKNPDGTQGYTWNPLTGCLNHVNGMCIGGNFPCYAYRLAHGRLKNRYLANSSTYFSAPDGIGGAQLRAANDPFYPRFWASRLHDRGLFQEETMGIFTCDMSDLFGIGIPEAWTDRVIDQVKVHRQHRFYLLTKQPQNLPTSPSYFPDNAWVGVTATNTRVALEACLRLGDIEATVRYLSLEPMLHSINLPYEHLKLCKINWLIIGACTGSYAEMETLIQLYPELTLMPYGNKWTAQPKIEWVREIVEAADKAGVSVFLKDSLKLLLTLKLQGRDVIESHNLWACKYFKLRQEMPKC